ncbi:MAG: NUMOD3 domain-containing DNA-binding protein [Candidatus Altiarchaeota archaeon]
MEAEVHGKQFRKAALVSQFRQGKPAEEALAYMVKKFHQDMPPEEVRRLYSHMNPSPLKFSRLPPEQVSEAYRRQRQRQKERADRIGQKKLGRSLTPATRKKIAEAGMGRVMSEESKKKISAANTGKIVSPETREKLRKAKLGTTQSEETKEKKRKASLGRVVTPQTRGRLSKALMGHSVSPEAREKIADAARMRTGRKNSFFGRHHTPETKKRLSERMSGEMHPMFGKHLSEEARRKISESKKGPKNPMFGVHKPHSPETKKSISESLLSFNKVFSAKGGGETIDVPAIDDEDMSLISDALSRHRDLGILYCVAKIDRNKADRLVSSHKLDVRRMVEERLTPYKLAPDSGIMLAWVYLMAKELGVDISPSEEHAIIIGGEAKRLMANVKGSDVVDYIDVIDFAELSSTMPQIGIRADYKEVEEPMRTHLICFLADARHRAKKLWKDLRTARTENELDESNRNLGSMTASILLNMGRMGFGADVTGDDWDIMASRLESFRESNNASGIAWMHYALREISKYYPLKARP